MDLLLPTGAVLGIDVGFSAKKRTTCFCLLAWDQSTVTVDFRITGSETTERARTIAELCNCRELAAVALDGPLVHDLELVNHYRVAEAILSRGVLQKRGKPGQTSAPTGRQLHSHATSLAKQVLSSVAIAASSHWQPIHERRIVEAFPNLFLAALIDEERLPVLARDASDRYWEVVVKQSDRIDRLIRHLLPTRRIRDTLQECGNHEKRAGVVCALTALCVAAGEHVAVGDPVDGDIMLPPYSTWGVGWHRPDSWLEPVLRANVCTARISQKAHHNHKQGRVATVSGPWFS